VFSFWLLQFALFGNAEKPYEVISKLAHFADSFEITSIKKGFLQNHQGTLSSVNKKASFFCLRHIAITGNHLGGSLNNAT